MCNINLNVPARITKGIIMLFEDHVDSAPFFGDAESFYNLKINMVDISIDGVPNQLYSHGVGRGEGVRDIPSS